MKTYVNIEDNKCPVFSRKHINVGDSVIVTDGSYMSKKDKGYVAGIDFRKEKTISSSLFQLLTVKATNVRALPTKDAAYGDSLRHLNNCVITDGETDYYCSQVNIIKFQTEVKTQTP